MTSPADAAAPAARAPLRTLRLASLGEAVTLLLLVCIAVPLKRLAGWPVGVSVMGPIHGAAFVMYTLMVLRHSGAGQLTARETAQLLLAAFAPFGAFLVGGIFKRRALAST